MIYLASPYNDEDMSIRYERYRQNVLATALLVRSGRIVFSPIVHNHPLAVQEGMPRDLEFWLHLDGFFLKRAKAFYILTLKGWRESRGIRAEVEIAREMGMAISYMTLLAQGRDYHLAPALPCEHFWDFAEPEVS